MHQYADGSACISPYSASRTRLQCAVRRKSAVYSNSMVCMDRNMAAAHTLSLKCWIVLICESARVKTSGHAACLDVTLGTTDRSSFTWSSCPRHAIPILSMTAKSRVPFANCSRTAVATLSPSRGNGTVSKATGWSQPNPPPASDAPAVRLRYSPSTGL